MKLIFCERCKDIVLLTFEKRACACGRSSGYYTDNINAVIAGNAIPLGIDNQSFAKALEGRKDVGLGTTFSAFVIPHSVPSITDTTENKE